MKDLEIKDDKSMHGNAFEEEKSDERVEIHVLESGQIEYSKSRDSSASNNEANCSSNYLSSETTVGQTELLSSSFGDAEYERTTIVPSSESSEDDHSSHSLSMDVSTQTALSLPIQEPPLIIHGNTKPNTSPTEQSRTDNDSLSPSTTQVPLRRSNRKLSQKTMEYPVPRERRTVRHMQRTRSGSPSPKKTKQQSINPVLWSVEEVTTFIRSIPRCNCAPTFQEHVSQHKQ